MLQVSLTERFITIDYYQLAYWMAKEEFEREYEQVLPPEELYDMYGDRWVLKPDYQMILDAIEEEYRDHLLHFEKENVAATVHAN